jgi:hypothetical protein
MVSRLWSFHGEMVMSEEEIDIAQSLAEQKDALSCTLKKVKEQLDIQGQPLPSYQRVFFEEISREYEQICKKFETTYNNSSNHPVEDILERTKLLVSEAQKIEEKVIANNPFLRVIAELCEKCSSDETANQVRVKYYETRLYEIIRVAIKADTWRDFKVNLKNGFENLDIFRTVSPLLKLNDLDPNDFDRLKQESIKLIQEKGSERVGNACLRSYIDKKFDVLFARLEEPLRIQQDMLPNDNAFLKKMKDEYTQFTNELKEYTRVIQENHSQFGKEELEKTLEEVENWISRAQEIEKKMSDHDRILEKIEDLCKNLNHNNHNTRKNLQQVVDLDRAARSNSKSEFIDLLKLDFIPIVDDFDILRQEFAEIIKREVMDKTGLAQAPLRKRIELERILDDIDVEKKEIIALYKSADGNQALQAIYKRNQSIIEMPNTNNRNAEHELSKSKSVVSSLRKIKQEMKQCQDNLKVSDEVVKNFNSVKERVEGLLTAPLPGNEKVIEDVKRLLQESDNNKNEKQAGFLAGTITEDAFRESLIDYTRKLEGSETLLKNGLASATSLQVLASFFTQTLPNFLTHVVSSFSSAAQFSLNFASGMLSMYIHAATKSSPAQDKTISLQQQSVLAHQQEIKKEVERLCQDERNDLKANDNTPKQP